jgi:hypothetical protein
MKLNRKMLVIGGVTFVLAGGGIGLAGIASAETAAAPTASVVTVGADQAATADQGAVVAPDRQGDRGGEPGDDNGQGGGRGPGGGGGRGPGGGGGPGRH